MSEVVEAAQGTIILVCGDRAMRTHLQRMLGRVGYTVRALQNGHEALAATRSAPPDLLLIEAHAVHLSGAEVCRLLRADPATADVALAVLLPPDDPEARLEALESGADDTVQLPVAAPELLIRVRHLLAQKGRRAETLRYERQLDALFALTSLIHVHLDLSQVLMAAHEAVRDQFGFQQVVVLLLDAERLVLRPATIVGMGQMLNTLEATERVYDWREMQHLLERRYQVGRSYFISRATAATDPLPPGPWLPGETLLVPLQLADGRYLGILSLAGPDDDQRPTREQVRWIELFAQHTAVAIHNAQLYAEQQRKVSAYVGAPVAAQLWARGAPPVAPHSQTVAVLFSDLREFTATAERLTPVQLVDQVLNPYFHYMTEVIHNHGGVVDKFLGDGIMALFGLPTWQGDEAARALLAGLAMQAVFRSLQDHWRHALGWDIGMGVGVASGPVVVGNVGSPQRLDYTAIGPVVNTASRVAAMAPAGQVWTTGDAATLADTYIYTDPARRAAFPMQFRPLMPTMLKGVTDLQTLYACFFA